MKKKKYKNKIISISIIITIISSLIIYKNYNDKLPFKYAVSIIPTPIYNTQQIHRTFDIKNNTLNSYDNKKLIRELETIALPQTLFKIEQIIKHNNQEILKIQTEEYPYKSKEGYFIDSRYVKKYKHKPKTKKFKTKTKEEIIAHLNNIKEENKKGKIQYIWGGNIYKGIPENILYYNQLITTKYITQQNLSKKDFNQYILKGLDCSGLLYEATNGYTPRNTSKLKSFGEALDIENKSIDEIIKQLKPLDLIVTPTHVIIILNDKETIESVYDKNGVNIEKIKDRLERLTKEYTPTNNPENKTKKDWFVIRRWIK